MPLAAVIGRAELLNAWHTGGEALHTGTFVAHPLGCAAALATLDLIAEEGLVARAAAIGDRIGELAPGIPAGIVLRGGAPARASGRCPAALSSTRLAPRSSAAARWPSGQVVEPCHRW
jgi:4-aminobutyrate aminotransferase/(S)-3-amino-2-methylpropionate transaminase